MNRSSFLPISMEKRKRQLTTSNAPEYCPVDLLDATQILPSESAKGLVALQWQWHGNCGSAHISAPQPVQTSSITINPQQPSPGCYGHSTKFSHETAKEIAS